MGLELQVRFWSYVHLVELLGISLYQLLVTVVRQPGLLARGQTKALREAHFDAFFAAIGPATAADPAQSTAIRTHLIPHVRGTVLDIGPGRGDQLYHFTPVLGRLGTVYGLEPNPALHAALLRNAARAGFRQGQYVPLTGGAEADSLFPALAAAGLVGLGAGGGWPGGKINGGRGAIGTGTGTGTGTGKVAMEAEAEAEVEVEMEVFDAVLSIKALCSSPQSQLRDTLAGLHKVLRPGGSFVVLEHVANDEDVLSAWVQRLLNPIWGVLVGGCDLRGSLLKLMRVQARAEGAQGARGASAKGPVWEEVQVHRLPEYSTAEAIPFVAIRAVKAAVRA